MKPSIRYDSGHTVPRTADRSAIRGTLSIALSRRLLLEQFDIKTVYLHKKHNHNKKSVIRGPHALIAHTRSRGQQKNYGSASTAYPQPVTCAPAH